MSCRRYIALWVVAVICSTNALDSNARSEDIYTSHHPIHKIAVIDDDGRMTEEEYAQKKGVPVEEVQNRLAATGGLKCDNDSTSAQITGANDTITTVAHMFKSKECAKRNEPKKCSFTVKVGGKELTSLIASLADIGYKCPGGRRKDDWAVLKLQTPIGVKPYALPYSDEKIWPDDPVISIAATSTDFYRVAGRDSRAPPKSIEECQGRYPYFEDGLQVMFASNCDSSQGSSGGSMLRERKRHDVLMAITAGNKETAAQINRAERTGVPTSRAFAEGKWASYHIPLKGAFLEAVEKAIGGRSP